MRLRALLCSLVAGFAVAAGVPAPALAAFHLMEIEQVIGGVNGDSTAQAVQLRMRAGGQNLLNGNVRLRAWDAAGANPVVLIAFSGTNPAVSTACSRILIATPSFEFVSSPAVSSSARNYLMSPMPASYLAAGSLTFENTAGTNVLWRLSWGGASLPPYSGPGTVAVPPTGNDADGTMSPPFAGLLPGLSVDALRFTPVCSTAPTNNSLQYGLTGGAATFVNNAGSSFVVTSLPPPVPALPDSAGLALAFGLGALAIGAAVLRRRVG